MNIHWNPNICRYLQQDIWIPIKYHSLHVHVYLLKCYICWCFLHPVEINLRNSHRTVVQEMPCLCYLLVIFKKCIVTMWLSRAVLVLHLIKLIWMFWVSCTIWYNQMLVYGVYDRMYNVHNNLHFSSHFSTTKG